MVAVPELIPVIIPVALPAVAIAGATLLHVPPGVASLRVVVIPGHSLAVPEIAATTGNGLTVTDFVTNEVPQVPETI